MRVTRSGGWRIPGSRTRETTGSPSASSVGLIDQPAQAAALLHHPLRLKILAALVEPDSAAGVARRMNLARQTVNYHVHELAGARLLARAGRRRRRRLFEQLYVATARRYVLSPDLLGPLAADTAQSADTFSDTADAKATT